MREVPLSLPDFASTEEEAKSRYQRFRRTDPFPSVAPALLNTADLLDYVAATAMIYPFRVPRDSHKEWLKPASCAIACGGEVIYWDSEYDRATSTMRPVRVERTLAVNEVLTLKPNSIVYVRLEPTFRMPDYMAARFNLTIRDIHRGLLVGTGPLVDPGFDGRLMVPLHNLTANEYPIVIGEPLVWMEFTKLSSNSLWQGTHDEERVGSYVPFPDYKRERKTAADYLDRAHRGPITSSIPPLVGEARSAAAASAADAAHIRQYSLVGGGVSVLVIALAMAALVVAVLGLIGDADRDRSDLRHDSNVLRQQVRSERLAVDRLERQIKALRARMAND